MVNYWKAKVLPKIKKVFENPKKAAAAEACKTFDDSKEQYSKEFEERKTELQPKVIEIYEACSTEIKGLVKEPKDAGIKKHSAAVQKFLDELAKIDFPGSKPLCESATKLGPGYLPGPVIFVFEKISTLTVVEEAEKKEEVAAPVAEAEPAPEKSSAEETSCQEAKEKDIAVEPAASAEKAETPAAADAACEPPKQ